MLFLSPSNTKTNAEAPPLLWDWVQWHDTESATRQGQATTAELPADNETVLLVPAERLSWHRVSLPKVQAGRLRQTLEGVLEDRLLDDPAQLHFALEPGANPERGPVTAWVSVCSKQWLQAALEDLRKHERAMARIVPAVEPTAKPLYLAQSNDDTKTLTLMGPEGVFRIDASTPSQNARTLLATAANDSSNEIAAWADPAAAQWAETSYPELPWQPTAPSLLVRQQAASRWNLAQFDLRAASHQRQKDAFWRAIHTFWKHKAWRPLRWGIASLAVVHLLGLNAMAWREKQNLKAQQAEMQTLLTQTFPHITLVLDAPLQMQREMDRLRQQDGEVANNSFEHLLQTLASASGTATLNLQEIRYQKDQASLRGLTLTQDQESALQAAGWQTQRQGDQWQLSRGAAR